MVKRILVVDDCVDTVEVVSTLLEILGHEARGAHSANEALEQVASFEPDIVLLDLMMPGTSGLAVAPRLRERCRRRFFMAALTGCGSRADRARTSELGFDGHVLKPIDRHALTRLVANARTES
jgi:CheY-like chemotaxis protein